MTIPQNPNESTVQIGKIAISIIPTIRTYSEIFVPVRFSGSSLIRTYLCTNGRKTLVMDKKNNISFLSSMQKQTQKKRNFTNDCGSGYDSIAGQGSTMTKNEQLYSYNEKKQKVERSLSNRPSE